MVVQQSRPGEFAARCALRREAAARRMNPASCGCPDPWRCHHRPAPRIDGDATLDAARHFDAHGLAGRFELDDLRAAWDSAVSGADRALLRRLAAGAAA